MGPQTGQRAFFLAHSRAVKLGVPCQVPAIEYNVISGAGVKIYGLRIARNPIDAGVYPFDGRSALRAEGVFTPPAIFEENHRIPTLLGIPALARNMG